jgi:hypothetical protein
MANSGLRHPLNRFSATIWLARPERLELPTYWFEASCSIRLSYGRVDIIVSFEQACPRANHT